LDIGEISLKVFQLRCRTRHNIDRGREGIWILSNELFQPGSGRLRVIVLVTHGAPLPEMPESKLSKSSKGFGYFMKLCLTPAFAGRLFLCESKLLGSFGNEDFGPMNPRS
jgi:hypothetical protein